MGSRNIFQVSDRFLNHQLKSTTAAPHADMSSTFATAKDGIDRPDFEEISVIRDSPEMENPLIRQTAQPSAIHSLNTTDHDAGRSADVKIQKVSTSTHLNSTVIVTNATNSTENSTTKVTISSSIKSSADSAKSNDSAASQRSTTSTPLTSSYINGSKSDSSVPPPPLSKVEKIIVGVSQAFGSLVVICCCAITMLLFIPLQ